MIKKCKIVERFYKKKYDTISRISNLKHDDNILDFGCEHGNFKKHNPDLNITEYDIDKRYTGIDDYRNTKPNKIMVLDVFEHMDEDNIRYTIKEFKKLNSNVIIVVSLPYGNIMSQLARMIVGKTRTVETHITSYRSVINILKEELTAVKETNFYFISYIGVFS